MSKVLFVEDGSVDVDELQEMLPEVPIIIYRQGSLKPEFLDIDTTVKVIKKEPCEPEGMCTDKALPVYTPEEIRNAISAALNLKGENSYNITVGEWNKVFILDPYSMDSFMVCVFQELGQMKTNCCGVDPSDD